MESAEVKIKCDTCGHSMLEFDKRNSEDYVDQSIDTDGDLWIFWKPSDCDNHRFYCCVECKIFKVCDLDNNEYQFIGHMGFHMNGSQWTRNSKNRQRAELPADTKITDPNTPRWDMSDSGKFDLKVDKWDLTGPLGGHKVFWYDCRLRRDLSFTDK